MSDQLPQPSAALAQFLGALADHSLPLRAPQYGILFDKGVTSIVLYRQGRFQIELIVVAPNCEIPKHTHEDVDTYEMQVSGAMSFEVAGIQTGFLREPRENGLHRDFMKYVPIAAGVEHAGNSGPAGAAFLSVQHWLKGDPTHVGMNWTGERVK